MSLPQPVMTGAEIDAFLARYFHEETGVGAFAVARVAHGEIALRFSPDERHIRPGGTVSGPAQFAVFDVAAYVAILAHAGPAMLQAVTTGANVDFLVRPKPGPLICTARLLKLGRRLAVCDGLIMDKYETVVARAGVTYSLPPAQTGMPTGPSVSQF